jgi:hypothetical protein
VRVVLKGIHKVKERPRPRAKWRPHICSFNLVGWVVSRAHRATALGVIPTTLGRHAQLAEAAVLKLE